MEPGDAGQHEVAERLGGVFLGLSHAAHVLHKTHVGELDLTAAQARALGVLGGCCEPPSMTALAQRLRVVPRAVTPIVDALEDVGYVRRVVDPGNRRTTLLELTEDGRSMVGRLKELRVRASAEMFSSLDAGERRTLLDLLEKVVAAQPEWLAERITHGRTGRH